MRFKYTICYVDDVAGTLRFYESAFGLERRFLHEGGDYGELSTGTTTISFSSHGLMKQLGKHVGRPDPAAPCFELAFETDDVAGAFARAIEAGAKPLQPPREEPWGQTTSYVEDLNGFHIEICSPVRTPS
jgi:uncharacterized glyoxalase superfamily protein PhnB